MGDQPRARSIKTLLIAGASVLALLLALLGAFAPRGERLEEVAPPVAVEPEQVAPLVDLEGERVAVERASVGGEALVTEALTDEAAPERSGYPVSGQFILTDCFGQEHAHLDGEFTLVYKRDGERLERAVPVEGGAFSFTVPDPSDFFVHDMELADREISLELEKELTGSLEDQRLLLTARDQCEVRLEVLDAETRGHLSSVEVWSVWDLDSSEKAVPWSADIEPSLRGVSSPISLPEVDLDWGSQRSYWVRSEGYAWAKVNVDHSRYSDQVVMLERGGTLGVQVEGLESETVGGSQIYLQLKRTGERSMTLERLGSSFQHEWESVPPGAYRVSVILGEPWASPLSLGTAEVTVRASEDAQVLFPVEAPEAPPGPVAVNGVVRAHEHWRDKGFALTFHASGETQRWEGQPPTLRSQDMESDPTDPDLLRWSAELPCEGAWEVSVKWLNVHQAFTASLAHTPTLELTIQAPAQVSMQIRDAETDAVLPGAQLWWDAWGSKSRRVHVWATLEFRPELGTHHITIPAGDKSFDILCDGYFGWPERVELIPGPQELAFQLEPVGRVDVRFMEGGAARPMSVLDLEFEVRPLEGSGDICEIWDRSLIFDTPGDYEVTFTGVPGYHDAVTTITAPKRGVVSHAIHLVRE
ncbi:MAG: hypothetical protein MK291_05790 [Planctomycetes bacterium]|nr:hypothetical protein [Planctomycetota bacterium]